MGLALHPDFKSNHFAYLAYGYRRDAVKVVRYKLQNDSMAEDKIIIDNIEPGINAEKPVELSRLYAHQKRIGQGVGQMLMDACVERARAENCDVMWLGVWEYNPRAQRFYEKNGFRIVGSHVFQLGEDAQTDLLMQREL